MRALRTAGEVAARRGFVLGRGMRRTLVRRASFVVARQAVVGDRLPRRGVRDELTVRRANPGVGVEGAEPDPVAARRAVVAPDGAAAPGAEALEGAAVA